MRFVVVQTHNSINHRSTNLANGQNWSQQLVPLQHTKSTITTLLSHHIHQTPTLLHKVDQKRAITLNQQRTNCESLHSTLLQSIPFVLHFYFQIKIIAIRAGRRRIPSQFLQRAKSKQKCPLLASNLRFRTQTFSISSTSSTQPLMSF